MMAVLTAVMLSSSGAALAAEKLAVLDVEFAPRVMEAGEKVRFDFRLTRDAAVVLEVFSPHYDLVRTVPSGYALPRGNNSLYWDGRDDWGVQVPPEAYMFALTATSADGEMVVYNPTTWSGGEELEMTLDRLENSGEGYKVHFTVPHLARVDIRAGIRNGPLLSNILVWSPLAPGSHAPYWDGLDSTGTCRVLDEPSAHIIVQAHKLPDNTILVTGAKKGYDTWREELLQKRPAMTGATINYEDVRSAAMVRLEEGISTFYATGASLNPPVHFAVYEENDLTTGLAEKNVRTYSGQARFILEVAPESLQDFNNGRYEIVVFLDNERMDEEEHAQSPYTYILDTTKLRDGLHTLTFNQAGLNGQITSYTFKINVQNG